MNEENSVLALYAAFAGFLLILVVAYKIISDYKEKRRSPRINFPRMPKSQLSVQKVHEEHGELTAIR